MTLTLKDKPEGHDHQDAYWNGKWFGYKGLITGRLGVIRCPKCDRENYGLAVASGACSWCGWRPEEEDHG